MKRIFWLALLPLLLLVAADVLPAQQQEYCVIEYAGETRNRTVAGAITGECPGQGIFPHSAPFGNWGVTSNYGRKSDGDQFPGWKRGTKVGTNIPNWQWNSCTTHRDYLPGNWKYYNANNFTTQVSSLGVASHGQRQFRVPVDCSGQEFEPSSNGCADHSVPTSWSQSNNFMTLYELDLADRDSLIETLYFPRTTASITGCNRHGCPEKFSNWVGVARSTSSSALVEAEMRMKVSGFLQSNCQWR